MEKLAEIEHEPTVAETLRAGVDLVCFSGDKLFGGPQAGIIAGKARFVSALKREPLFRALRCDKLAFSALQATTELHLAKDFAAIPILNFLKCRDDRSAGSRRQDSRPVARPPARHAN